MPSAIDVLGFTTTIVFGINDATQIVGTAQGGGQLVLDSLGEKEVGDHISEDFCDQGLFDEGISPMLLDDLEEQNPNSPSRSSFQAE
jgi:hypothetical protein